MGRPKKEQPLTSKERYKRWKENNPDKYKRHVERTEHARKNNSEANLETKREEARLRKQKSRANQRSTFSRQKLLGMKIADRNRKRAKKEALLAAAAAAAEPARTSTERVQKHRSLLKVMILLSKIFLNVYTSRFGTSFFPS